MPDFSTEIDIEPWEYISACSKREVKELIESLVEEGHLNSFNGKVVSKGDTSPMSVEWDEALTKIRNSKHLLSIDDENVIINIANKLF